MTRSAHLRTTAGRCRSHLHRPAPGMAIGETDRSPVMYACRCYRSSESPALPHVLSCPTGSFSSQFSPIQEGFRLCGECENRQDLPIHKRAGGRQEGTRRPRICLRTTPAGELRPSLSYSSFIVHPSSFPETPPRIGDVAGATHRAPPSSRRRSAAGFPLLLWSKTRRPERRAHVAASR